MNEECVAMASETTCGTDPEKAYPDPDETIGYELELVCRSCGNRWPVLPGPNGHFIPGFWF
jgi:hypothetical protein